MSSLDFVRRSAWALALAALIATATTEAFAAPAPDFAGQIPANPAADKANVQAIIDKSPNAAEVWTLRDDGSLVHKPSGLVCAAKYGSVELWHLLVYGPPSARGVDVGCDYGRGLGHTAETKLTIFFVKLAENETLDSVFGKYQAEIHQAYPAIVAKGPALTVSSKNGAPPPTPDFRSEEYTQTIDGREAQSDLIVSIVDGWVIEIRATYFMDNVQSAADAALPAFTWVMVTGSKMVGK